MRAILASFLLAATTACAGPFKGVTHHDVAFLNGWENYGSDTQPVTYSKDAFGVVRIRGVMKNGAQGVAFVLPPGFRPAAREHFLCFSTEKDGSAYVTPAGEVIVDYQFSNMAFSLSGISFFAP